jgi:hypothetical protein
MKTRLAPLLAALLLATPGFGGTPEEDLALGIKQVEEGDFQAALQILEGVSRRLSGDKARSKELARAYLYIGIAYVGMSQETEAKGKFLQAWKNDPALKLSPEDWAPRYVRTFEEAIKDAPVDAASISLFIDAAKRGDVAALRLLLQRTRGVVNLKDPEFGATALHWATLRRNKLAVAFLVGAGADLAARNNAGEMPLDVAQRDKQEELLPYLQSPGPGLPPAQGEIFEAVKRGDLGRVRQIVAADPPALNRKDAEFGATPLHWAALRGYAATAAYLVGAGADPGARNASGETPYTVAQRAGKTDVAEVVRP